MYESLANSNRRSRCHCRLRLVVRYVISSFWACSCDCRCSKMLQSSILTFAKATTSPLSVTVTLSTRSLRTSAPQLWARNRRVEHVRRHGLSVDKSSHKSIEMHVSYGLGASCVERARLWPAKSNTIKLPCSFCFSCAAMSHVWLQQCMPDL